MVSTPFDIEALDLDEHRRTAGGLIIGRRRNAGIVLLDRPEKGNAVDSSMLAELEQLWLDIALDRTLRAVVFGSTSPRFLCTGRDVNELGGLALPGPEVSFQQDFKLTWRRAGVWTPIICAVEGKTVGAGLHFPIDADLVVAGHSAWFADSHVNVGLVGGLEVVGLTAKIGLGNALYLTLLGRDGGFDAQRALAAGLVQEVVDDGTALARSLELADLISASSPAAVSRTVQAGWGAVQLGEAQRYAWQLIQRQLTHPDAAEGPAAWAQRRPPEWAT
jgi:enoyl-CoA hydratase/carnithine racemase